MQEDDINGLQIKHNGGWVPVKPIPGALVVNVGDVIEIMSTNGKYKSIEHRAVTNQTKTRISYKLNFWPRTPKGFKEIIESYSNGVKEAIEELLRSFSRIMGMDKDTLLGLHKQVAQGMRVNYYPTCSRPDLVLGISPHSDSSTITILMQEDDTEGLQIKHNEEWVPVKPVQDALVVNVGDVIEIWSNGKYNSIEHRAVTNQKQARISYASFMVPHDDVEIEPLDHLVGSQKLMYQKVRYGDYLRSSMKRRMDGKAHTGMAKITT